MPQETFATLSIEEREELVFSACDEPHEKRDWTPSEKESIRESITTQTASFAGSKSLFLRSLGRLRIGDS
jgi:hypothetical protein